MDFMTIWSIIGIIGYLFLAIKDFIKSDWGIKEEFLNAKNRSKWQKLNAIYEIGIAFFGTLSMIAYNFLENKILFLMLGAATLIIFFFSLSTNKLLKK